MNATSHCVREAPPLILLKKCATPRFPVDLLDTLPHKV